MYIYRHTHKHTHLRKSVLCSQSYRFRSESHDGNVKCMESGSQTASPVAYVPLEDEREIGRPSFT